MSEDTMSEDTIRELDMVALLADLPQDGVRRGHVGTIVFVHDAGEAFEVEFPFGPRRSVVTTVGREKLLHLIGLDTRVGAA